MTLPFCGGGRRLFFALYLWQASGLHDLNVPIARVSDAFINVNIDAASLYQSLPQCCQLDFTNGDLQRFTDALVQESAAPLTLRIGGSAADDIGFDLTAPMRAYAPNQLIQINESYASPSRLCIPQRNCTSLTRPSAFMPFVVFADTGIRSTRTWQEVGSNWFLT